MAGDDDGEEEQAGCSLLFKESAGLHRRSPPPSQTLRDFLGLGPLSREEKQCVRELLAEVPRQMSEREGESWDLEWSSPVGAQEADGRQSAGQGREL